MKGNLHLSPMGNLHIKLVLLLLACSFLNTSSFWWSSSSPDSSTDSPKRNEQYDVKAAEFALRDISGSKGIKLVEDAKRKMAVPNSCWHNAYRALFQSCSEIVSNEERKNRLAWLLSDCFQAETGRPALPACKESAPMVQCLKRLGDSEHKIFLEFFMETNNICHQIQGESFKYETERLVNELAKSAHFAEDKLDAINEKSEKLLQDSSQLHDSVSSVHEETQRVAQATRDVETQMHDVLESSQAINQQSKAIAESQLELKEAQIEMSDAVKKGMAWLEESYESLGKGMDNLMKETIEIEKEVKVVGESMVSKMQDLQGTANSIESVAGSSLEKQQKLLEIQNEAMEGLDSLRKFQSDALKESRDILERFSEFGHKQHKELLRRQDEIQKTHDHLYQTSQAILEAQKEFELRQSDIFSMLEKLYALYKAVLDESRFVKAVFAYLGITILLHLFTSAKQTNSIRGLLYLGLGVTLLLEIIVNKLGTDEAISKISVARLIFLTVAVLQIVYSVFTYRDNEKLRNGLLQTVVVELQTVADDVRVLKTEVKKFISLPLDMETDDDDSLSNYSWIDDELPEDVDINEDPNYPEDVTKIFSTTIMTTKNYDLRPRRHDRH